MYPPHLTPLSQSDPPYLTLWQGVRGAGQKLSLKTKAFQAEHFRLQSCIIQYILCNTYYRIHFTIHMLQCMLYDIFYTIQYLNNIYSIKYTMYCSVCIIWYKFYHFVCLFRYILYDIYIYLVCFALLVSYSLYCLVCVVLCAL